MKPTPRRRYRWLLALPFVWQVALIPAVNDVHVFPLGLPFPMFWQMLGVVFATAIIGLVFRLDRRAGVEAEEEAFLLECEAEDRAGRGDEPR